MGSGGNDTWCFAELPTSRHTLNALRPPSSPWEQSSSHVSHEETETQRGLGACLRSHSKWQSWDVNPGNVATAHSYHPVLYLVGAALASWPGSDNGQGGEKERKGVPSEGTA